MNRWQELREVVDRISRQLDQLDRRAEKMEVILMVREPTVGAAAEAYDGLRKQVVAAVGERTAHLKQLAQLDAALAAGAGADAAAKLVRDFADQAALERVTNAENTDYHLLFDIVEDLGGNYEVLEAAYVDAKTGRVIRRGSMRGSASATSAQAGAAEQGKPTEEAFQ